MPFFKIHGHASCPNFSHAIVVAQYLSERLPNFEFKKTEVATREWGVCNRNLFISGNSIEVSFILCRNI